MTIATTEAAQPQPDMGAFDERDAKVLDYLGLNPNNPADRAAVMVCRAYDLDAVLKHVIVIPRGGVYITRDGLLHIAHRSGQLDGIVVDREPELDGNEWVARVSVYRKDMRHPFTFPGRYSVNGSNKQYAQEMALKSAEAHALRRAFAVTGLPTYDEQRPASEQHEASAGLADALADDGTTDGEVVEPITARTRGQMFALFSDKGVEEKDQLPGINHICGKTYTSRADLTETDAREVIRVLKTKPDVVAQGELVEEPS